MFGSSDTRPWVVPHVTLCMHLCQDGLLSTRCAHLDAQLRDYETSTMQLYSRPQHKLHVMYMVCWIAWLHVFSRRNTPSFCMHSTRVGYLRGQWWQWLLRSGDSIYSTLLHQMAKHRKAIMSNQPSYHDLGQPKQLIIVTMHWARL